ncbi:MAG: phage terminase large subunit [Clostridia bacterium]|nr:phage terminase large subunit [Clostridia bacterium]
MELEIEVPEVYEPAFNDIHIDKCCKNLWYSPRTSWKSSGLGRIVLLYYNLFPEYDVCIGVDSMSNAGEGVLSEFQSFLESEGLNENGDWRYSSTCVYQKGHKNQIRVYSVQTNEHTNVNATKGKKLIRPISLFIMDEVQKLHNKEVLLNCLSTFLRQMKAGHSKVILAGNPDRASMWFTEFYKAKLNDPEWTVLRPTYKDIIEWIPDSLKHEIEDLEKNDPISYRQIYLGDLDAAGWEVVFHSFIEDKHYIERDALIENDPKFGVGGFINAIVIGVDDAESRDAIAASALTVHNNGLMRCQESFYKSCKELSVKPALTERCEMIIKYLDYINSHFNQEHTIPIIFAFDCASGMYRQMLVIASTDKNYLRWRNVRMFAYKSKQEKEKQLDLVNAAIANRVLTIVNVDKYSPQYSNNKLVEQIKALRLLENNKIDPTIPNDCTDALQYAAMMVLGNPYNLSFPQRLKRYEEDGSLDAIIDRIRNQDKYGRI